MTVVATFIFIQIEKEELHNKIIQLEKQLDAKQALELEIERLRGTSNVMKHMSDGGDAEVRQKMETVLKDLREKEGELEDLEALNQTLIIKERKSNDDLQDARKELTNVSISSSTSLATYFSSQLDDFHYGFTRS